MKRLSTILILSTTLVLMTSCDKDKKTSAKNNHGNSSPICDELTPLNYNPNIYTQDHGSAQRYQVNFNLFLDKTGRTYRRQGNIYTATDNHREVITCNRILNSQHNQNCSHVRFDQKHNVYYDKNTNKDLATYDHHKRYYVNIGTTTRFLCTLNSAQNFNHGGYNSNGRTNIGISWNYSYYYHQNTQNLCHLNQWGCNYYGGPTQSMPAFTHNGINYEAGLYAVGALVLFGILSQ